MSRRPLVGRLALLVLAIVALLVTTVPAASAHPLGNFTVNRYTGLLVSPDGVTVEHVVDLAEIPTAQLGHRLDDLPALATDECAKARPRLSLVADGRPLTLTGDDATASTKPGEGGLPITRISCRFDAPVDLSGRDSTRLEFQDSSASGVVGWREVTAVGDRMTLAASDVPQDSVSKRLTTYPTDMLTSPLSVTAANLTVQPGGPAASLAEAADVATPAGPASALTSRVTDLLGEHGMLAALLALVLAVVLGASHALAPGHGKTVMAFYLSQRGDSSWRSAALVGGSVTAAHTGSVLLLGLLVSMGTAFVPARIYPWLTLATGLLIVGLGASLLRSARRSGGSSHGHGHGHGHGHRHGHGHGHGHGPAEGHAPVAVLEPTTAGTPQPAASPGRLGLWAMGLVGGLVPSPSALLLLLAATALGRAWFGVVLVVAFGIGMAASLAAVGLLARDVVFRIEAAALRRGLLGGGLRAVLSYGAATGVCAIGAVIVVRALGGL